MKQLNQIKRKYYDYLVGTERNFNKQIAWLDHIFQKHNVKSVLDCGCGTGTHTILLAKKGYDVTAFDVKPMVSLAKEKAKKNKVNINFKVGDIKNFNYGKFDAVISLYSVLMFACKTTKELEKAVECMKNSLNRNGIAFFETCTPRNKKELGFSIRKYADKNVKIVSPVFYDEKSKNLFDSTYVYVIKEENKYPRIIFAKDVNRHFTKSEVVSTLKKQKLKIIKLYGVFDGKRYRNYSEEGNFISPLFTSK